MAKALDAVRKNGDLWDFVCPGVPGSPCGDLATGTPFLSVSWPTKKAAAARGAQHLAEHEGGDPMQPMDEFLVDQALVVVQGRVVDRGADQ